MRDGWIYQGRQHHMWFGHGTKPKDDVHAEPHPSLPSLAARIHDIGMTLVAGLPASLRNHSVANLNALEHSQLDSLLTEASSSSAVVSDNTARKIFGRPLSAPGIEPFIKAGQLLRTAKTYTDLRNATILVARSALDMGLDRFRPFLREASEKSALVGITTGPTINSGIQSSTSISTNTALARLLLGRVLARIDPRLDLIADQSEFHDKVRDDIAARLRALGNVVETEVRIQGYAPNPRTQLPAPARADIIAQHPVQPPYVIEIKTGESPGYTIGQRVTYPQVMIGHAFSDDKKIEAFGLNLGQTIPPLKIIEYYQFNEYSPYHVIFCIWKIY